MPPLTDSILLALFKSVLAEWNCTGYVTATDRVMDWIAKNLGGLTLKDIAKTMNDFVVSGGCIDQVPETRPEWDLWPFHYDFRLSLVGRKIYIETILQDDDPTDPTISYCEYSRCLSC